MHDVFIYIYFLYENLTLHEFYIYKKKEFTKV